MVFSLVSTGFLKAMSKLPPDRGDAMAAQALRALNFRHYFNGIRRGMAMILGCRIAVGGGVPSPRASRVAHVSYFQFASRLAKFALQIYG
ncbi:hypothetical protein [Rhizobium etli]|uniref:hypothetical protein n=1 Tax=Rhizobium etli TaxID=29449 RepID=UPI00140FB5C9|nr:hypothetical protein [Rhizobium etli]